MKNAFFGRKIEAEGERESSPVLVLVSYLFQISTDEISLFRSNQSINGHLNEYDFSVPFLLRNDTCDCENTRMNDIRQQMKSLRIKSRSAIGFNGDAWHVSDTISSRNDPTQVVWSCHRNRFQ